MNMVQVRLPKLTRVSFELTDEHCFRAAWVDQTISSVKMLPNSGRVQDFFFSL